MSMNVGSADDEEDAISTINTTPLVDVMLVLLIIFLITVPVVRMTVPVELPKERNEIRETKPENIVISVDSQARIYWNELRMPNTNALVERLKKVAVLTPQPEVQIRGDINVQYRCIGAAIYTMQRAGFARIGFISAPPPEGGQRL